MDLVKPVTVFGDGRGLPRRAVSQLAHKSIQIRIDIPPVVGQVGHQPMTGC